MKNKNQIYIVVSSLLFILLLAIHAYYFYNSYQLKEKEIVNSIHSELSDATEKSAYFLETTSIDNDILALFSKFQTNHIDAKAVSAYFEHLKSKKSPEITAFIDSLFSQRDYQIALKKELKYLITLPAQDTLIKTPFILYQTTTPVLKNRIITEGKWVTSKSNSEHDSINQPKLLNTDNSKFQINRITYFDIANLSTIVLKELIPLMISSLLILVALLILYYLTYKNLVKHRQESIILHDIVDNITHEFSTPIATLKIASRTLARGDTNEILPLIDRQITRLESLLKPINTSHKELDTREKLTERDALHLLSDNAFTYPHIHFEKDIHLIEPVIVSKLEFEAIINNLISNSIKYGSQTIHITIASTPNRLDIQIVDDGIGMEQNELKHITKKFYRIQKNNVQNTKGLGLGLYLVHKIVLKYHGTLHFRSKLNGGTTVKIKITDEN